MALPDHKIMLKQLIRDGKRKVRGLNSLDYGLLLNRKKKKMKPHVTTTVVLVFFP